MSASVSPLPLTELARLGPQPVEQKEPKSQTCDRIKVRLTNAASRYAFGSHWCTMLVFALPALLLGYLIYSYGVDTPWGDQWEANVPLFQKMQAGTLRIGDFFAFHNEHRHFFPRLLSFGLALVTHWNIRAELFASWLLLCLSGLAIWRLASYIGWRTSPSRDWLLVAGSVLLFTPIQGENLLWGFQIGFILPIAATVAAIAIAACARRVWSKVAALALCAVSTFSVASGFTAWLLVAPPLFLANHRSFRSQPKLLAVWGAGAVVSVIGYFHGYKRPPWHPSIVQPLRHPLMALRFILVYLGQTFSHGRTAGVIFLAKMIGAFLVAVVALSAWYVWRQRDRALASACRPWFSLAGIALSNAILTMIGRVGFGLSAAGQSRYVSFALMLPLSLLFVVPVVMEHWRRSRARDRRMQSHQAAAVAVLLIMAGLLLNATFGCLKSWHSFQHTQLLGKAAIMTSRLLDESAGLRRHVYSSGAAIIPLIEVLDRADYLHPPRLSAPDIGGIAFRNDGMALGRITELASATNGEFVARGWAIMPVHGRAADSVLLTYTDRDGHSIIFARADVGDPRDGASVVDSKRNDNAGWSKRWKPNAIPAQAVQLTAWALDAEDGRAFKIAEASLEPHPNR